MSDTIDVKQYTDHELMFQMNCDNQNAFSEIYNRYWHSLFLHAYKMLGNEDEAKDVIQDLFISLWDKRKCLRLKTNLKAYLYFTTRNRVINHIRKHRISDLFINEIARGISLADTGTQRTLEEKDLIQIIDNEINNLPPRMRTVFELSRRKYLTHKEIAEKLGTSEETIKKQISNSLKILKQRIGKQANVCPVFLIFF